MLHTVFGKLGWIQWRGRTRRRRRWRVSFIGHCTYWQISWSSAINPNLWPNLWQLNTPIQLWVGGHRPLIWVTFVQFVGWINLDQLDKKLRIFGGVCFFFTSPVPFFISLHSFYFTIPLLAFSLFATSPLPPLPWSYPPSLLTLLPHVFKAFQSFFLLPPLPSLFSSFLFLDVQLLMLTHLEQLFNTLKFLQNCYSHWKKDDNLGIDYLLVTSFFPFLLLYKPPTKGFKTGVLRLVQSQVRDKRYS